MYRLFAKPLTLITILAITALVNLTACEKATTDQPDTPAAASSTLELYLTDSPADYSAVWIDIQKIMIHLSGDTTSEGGWQELTALHSGKYNLLDLRNGVDTLLASEKVPEGRLTQIRLFLGTENSVVLKNGDSNTLFIPSGDVSFINLQVENFALQAGVPFELVLDFDVAHSVHEPARQDSGNYYINPVIRVFARGAGASIQGMVYPDSAHAHVMAVSSGDTLTAIPERGFFKFWGIPAGAYDLFFVADSASGYRNDTLWNIQAEEGKVFQTDTVWLQR